MMIQTVSFLKNRAFNVASSFSEEASREVETEIYRLMATGVSFHEGQAALRRVAQRLLEDLQGEQ